MKVFDLHIGVSDSVIQLKKNIHLKGNSFQEFPNQFDYLRAKEGNLNIFCGMICPIQISDGKLTLPTDQKGEIKKHLSFFQNEDSTQNLKIVKTAQDLKRNKIKTVLGLEGVYFIKNEEDFEFLEELINKNIKIIGFKWNFQSKLFNSKNKLTTLGKEFLKLCQQKNIILDLAHSEGDIIDELLSNFSGNVIDTHTCLFSINPVQRNIKDSFIKEILERNGLVGINFVGEFVGGNTIEKLLTHFEYFINKFGITGLAIGSDFDGMDQSDLISDLEDVSKYKLLAKNLKNIGLNTQQIEQIVFDNANLFIKNSI